MQAISGFRSNNNNKKYSCDGVVVCVNTNINMESNGKREIRLLERTWLALLLFLLGVALVSVVRGEESAIFAHYNLENYLVMDRRENGTLVHSSKLERERDRAASANHPRDSSRSSRRGGDGHTRSIPKLSESTSRSRNEFC